MLRVKLTRKGTQLRDQKSGLEFIVRRILSSKPNWEMHVESNETPSIQGDNLYHYEVVMIFTRVRGHEKTEAKDREKIIDALKKVGSSAKFKSYPWRIEVLHNVFNVEVDGAETHLKTQHALSEIKAEEFAKIKERVLPLVNNLLENGIEDSGYFKGIFERDAQIRLILSSIKSFLETDGARRNHVVLYGLPACAKTQILNAVADLIGKESLVRLDGTSTTPAGIYKVYFEEFEELPEPPFVILEEAEKTSEESLRVWLGVLDDRGELRKVNAREMRQRDLKVLCFSTVNDKEIFDTLMGGSKTKPGALSSRFVHQLECPRPNRRVMQLILTRDIEKFGGKMEWIEPILHLMESTDTTDPRRVLSFIDGGDRLLTGAYQKDVIEVYKVTPKIPEIRMEN